MYAAIKSDVIQLHNLMNPCHVSSYISYRIFLFLQETSSEGPNKKKDAIFYTTTFIGRLFLNHLLQFSEMESKYK